jgi:pimeloyl-ACP methyl ester carboxylesterase
MLPGHTYAVWMTTDVRAASGDTIARAENLAALLAASTPSDPMLQAHYEKYAPFRAYLNGVGVNAEKVLNATVFTVAAPTNIMADLAGTVAALPAPTASAWTRCDGATSSPCPQAEGVRACGVNAAFDEYHLLINLPIFQKGTAPYKDEGGNVQTDAPVRYEQVCAAMTVPKGLAAGAPLPLVIATHGTGGSFRTHVDSGIATSLSAVAVGGQTVNFAVLGFDQVEHGPRRGDSTESPDNLFFNFMNPDASRGNPLQGAVDLISAVRFARTLQEGTGPVDVDPERILVFGHSQGSMHATLALPYIDNLEAAVLSGNGVSLMHGLLTKTLPVNIAELVPLLISDGLYYDEQSQSVRGTVPGGTHHPVLSVIQRYIDPGDGVNFARLLTASDAPHPTHLFQTFGLDDHFSPPTTLGIFAGVARLAVAQADPSATPPYNLGAEWPTFPVEQTMGNGGNMFTAAVRQYGPGELSDGHFVAFQVPSAVEDVRQFLGQAALGMSPAIGH